MRFLLPRDPEREMVDDRSNTFKWSNPSVTQHLPVSPTRYLCERACLVALSLCSWIFTGPLAAYVRALGNEFPASRGISGRRVQPAYAALAGRPGIHRLIHLQSQHSSPVVPLRNVHSIHPVLDILRLQRTTRNNF